MDSVSTALAFTLRALSGNAERKMFVWHDNASLSEFSFCIPDPKQLAGGYRMCHSPTMKFQSAANIPARKGAEQENTQRLIIRCNAYEPDGVGRL
jgi:hypothetical protein